MKALIIFLIFQFFYLNSYKYRIVIKDSQTRWTYNIYNKDKEIIYKKIYLYEDEHKRNLANIYLIYISNDEKKYIEIGLHRAIDDLGKKGYKIAKANKHRPFKKQKDTGVERYYKFKIVFNDKFYEFDIFGDVTYFYLYDEEGNKRQNKEAISYLISKDERIKEFIELMANDDTKLFFPFKYVLKYAEKDFIKSIGINEKKYKIKEMYFPCTEAEKLLNHNCDKYFQIPKKKDK